MHTPYVLKFWQGLIFVVFKAIRKSLNQVPMQWQNMAVCEYKNVKIAKSQNQGNTHPAKIKVYTVLYIDDHTILHWQTSKVLG